MAKEKQQNNVNEIAVGGVQYAWNIEEGQFQLEGEDIMVFWIETAMRSFIDTIEEVSGDDAAEVVMETAGFRMGEIVADFFVTDDPFATIKSLPAIYASAGWGNVEIIEISEKENKLTLRLKNTWEYKINKVQGKEALGLFIPGHWAGILSSLLGTTIGYEGYKSQVEGEEYDEISFFPSTASPVKNIHEFTRRQEQQEIEKLEALVSDRTKDLENIVREISSPIIPVLENVVVVPLLGKYDGVRAEDMLNRTMEKLPDYSANYLILDLTGIETDIDEYTISLIQRLTQAVDLLGTKSILVGISPELGIRMTNSKFDLSGMECFTNLKHAVHFALAQEGKQIIG
ncbi:STAS domain-containing protein [Salsuginibacillus kocurii]|uniref:STAS domain-containing protein n=1 Tax=Salsuginibacillus kocurii TaxID=427078 RepID=UPI00035F3EF5|nr:STAS domain-containing protein [Salsuginibacillus kocurii]